MAEGWCAGPVGPGTAEELPTPKVGGAFAEPGPHLIEAV